MRYAGVLFDLFGTLVKPFRRREHEHAMAGCSTALGVPAQDCLELWSRSFPERVRGRFSGVGDNFRWIAAELGHRAPDAAVAEAKARYLKFTEESLEPVDGVVELLASLSARGVKAGLVTNCAPDVPSVWADSAFAPFFQHCSFSCGLGEVKPDAAIYHDALDGLGLEPGRTLYVGDGSDEELTGAARCGMTAVLVAADLSNTYDSVRLDVADWSGLRVAGIPEVARLIG
ncbi:HAD family hydrolase [Nonomuraea sp. NPDC050153]|uniref:HAD family hydrolase n=1 Tax=Nonomuraea sp. NPDC050153 TaxID=3364359 RepID=UPI0037A71EF2